VFKKMGCDENAFKFQKSLNILLPYFFNFLNKNKFGVLFVD
jgi:hypothetical protein